LQRVRHIQLTQLHLKQPLTQYKSYINALMV